MEVINGKDKGVMEERGGRQERSTGPASTSVDQSVTKSERYTSNLYNLAFDYIHAPLTVGICTNVPSSHVL